MMVRLPFNVIPNVVPLIVFPNNTRLLVCWSTGRVNFGEIEAAGMAGAGNSTGWPTVRTCFLPRRNHKRRSRMKLTSHRRGGVHRHGSRGSTYR